MPQKTNHFQLLLSLAMSSMILSLLASCTTTTECDRPATSTQQSRDCSSGSGGTYGGSSYRGGGSRSNGDRSSVGGRSSGRSGFGSFGGGRAGG